MDPCTYLEHYETLLAIRHRGTLRVATVLRWALVVALLGFYATGVLGYLEDLSLYLAIPVLVAFGIGYVLAQARCDATASLLEFVRGAEESPVLGSYGLHGLPRQTRGPRHVRAGPAL